MAKRFNQIRTERQITVPLSRKEEKILKELRDLVKDGRQKLEPIYRPKATARTGKREGKKGQLMQS